MNKHRRLRRAALAGWLLVAAGVARAGFITILTEDFSEPSGWTYQGPLQSGGLPLFRPEGGRLAAEWDQSNVFDGSGDPYVIEPAAFFKPLGMTLTDTDTFRVSAMLRLDAVVDTTEMWQIANFGLYHVALHGPDRGMSDNWSGNQTLLRDGSDFVEFNYFINNRSHEFNPNITATIGAHIAGLEGEYTTGSGTDPLWNSTDLGADNWLPTGVDLHVRLTYFGAADDAARRRAHVGIYADASAAEPMTIHGVDLVYWTVPFPDGKGLTLTDVAFYNYPGANWGGPNGTGAGSFSDLRVEMIPEPSSAGALLLGLAAWRIRRLRRVTP